MNSWKHQIISIGNKAKILVQTLATICVLVFVSSAYSQDATSVVVPSLKLQVHLTPSKFGQPIGAVLVDGVFRPEVQAYINEQISGKTYSCGFLKVQLDGCVNTRGFTPTRIQVLEERVIWSRSENSHINLVLTGTTWRAGTESVTARFAIPIQRVIAFADGEKSRGPKYWETSEVRQLTKSSELRNDLP